MGSAQRLRPGDVGATSGMCHFCCYHTAAFQPAATCAWAPAARAGAAEGLSCVERYPECPADTLSMIMSGA